MKNFNNITDYTEITNRVKLLSNANVRKWGRMSLQQMQMHCSTHLRLALGEISPGVADNCRT